jgi:hypothetical protein
MPSIGAALGPLDVKRLVHPGAKGSGLGLRCPKFPGRPPSEGQRARCLRGSQGEPIWRKLLLSRPVGRAAGAPQAPRFLCQDELNELLYARLRRFSREGNFSGCRFGVI